MLNRKRPWSWNFKKLKFGSTYKIFDQRFLEDRERENRLKSISLNLKHKTWELIGEYLSWGLETSFKSEKEVAKKIGKRNNEYVFSEQIKNNNEYDIWISINILVNFHL